MTEHIWLDYPDGACEDADAEDAVAQIAAIIENVQPDSILTFGPDGMTGHHDHRTVCEWTTRAVEKLGLPPGALHHASLTCTGTAIGVKPLLEPPGPLSASLRFPDQSGVCYVSRRSPWPMPRCVSRSAGECARR